MIRARARQLEIEPSREGKRALILISKVRRNIFFFLLEIKTLNIIFTNNKIVEIIPGTILTTEINGETNSTSLFLLAESYFTTMQILPPYIAS